MPPLTKAGRTAAAGWRYLGPAEWRDWGNETARLVDTHEAYKHAIQWLRARVTELEAENASLSEREIDDVIRAPVTAASTFPGDEVFPLDMDPKPTHFSGIGAAVTVSAPTATEDRATDPVGPNDETHQQVERVIGDLVNNRVVQPARKALREALDKADAPPRGRTAADAGLGRAISRMPR